MFGNQGGGVLEIRLPGGHTDDEIETLISGEVVAVAVDLEHQHHERPGGALIAVDQRVETGHRLQQGRCLHGRGTIRAGYDNSTDKAAA